jgi:hypothetical protein
LCGHPWGRLSSTNILGEIITCSWIRVLCANGTQYTRLLVSDTLFPVPSSCGHEGVLGPSRSHATLQLQTSTHDLIDCCALWRTVVND